MDDTNVLRRILQCLFSLIIVGANGLFAQPVTPLSAAPDGVENRAKIIQELGRGEYLIHSNPDSANVIFRRAIRLAQEISDDSLLMEVYFQYCRVAQMKTEFDTALFYTRKAGAIAVKNQYTKRYGEYYNFLARFHKYLNHPDSALYYMRTYDEYLEERGRDDLRWLPQQQLASFYQDLQDLPRANYHINEALKYARLTRKPKDYLYVLYTAIHLYAGQDSLKNVSALSEEYLSFKLEQGSDILDNNQHSHLNFLQMDSTGRVDMIQKYLEAFLANGDLLSALASYHSLGAIHARAKDYASAIAAYESGLAIANCLSFPNLRYMSHSALFALHDETQNHAKALFHHKAMTSVYDTIRNADREHRMHELEVQYETARTEHELAEANFKLENAKRTQLFFVLIGVALLMIVGIILYAYRQKRKAAKQLEEKNALISKSLTEKDILLREIHHRVKNNLQMISALLYLHGKSVEDVSAQEALMESQNRVQSMAMIHQNLYQDENLLGVSVKSYLDRLLSHLVGSYNVEKDRIAIRTQIEVDHLDVDTIVPLALIINELISNSLKYAFPDGRKGLIEVYVGYIDSRIRVEVKDNGVGLPVGFTMHTSTNFGYKLINILSERLGAELTMLSKNGTLVALSIPVKKAA